VETTTSNKNNLCSLLIQKGYSLFIIEDNYKHYLNDSAETKIKLTTFDNSSLEDMPFVNVLATIHIDRIKAYIENKNES
jgi:hypothetical protein